MIGNRTSSPCVQMRFTELDVLKCNRFPQKNNSVITSILHISRRSSNNLIHSADNSAHHSALLLGHRQKEGKCASLKRQHLTANLDQMRFIKHWHAQDTQQARAVPTRLRGIQRESRRQVLVGEMSLPLLPHWKIHL